MSGIGLPFEHFNGLRVVNVKQIPDIAFYQPHKTLRVFREQSFDVVDLTVRSDRRAKYSSWLELQKGLETGLMTTNAKFVYLGAAAYGNEILPVRIQIDQRNGFKKIESYDVLKSFNTKIGKIASQNKNAPLGVSTSPNAPATISIANLIGIAQPLHPQIFSRDVANALGVPYRGNEIQAKLLQKGLETGLMTTV